MDIKSDSQLILFGGGGNLAQKVSTNKRPIPTIHIEVKLKELYKEKTSLKVTTYCRKTRFPVKYPIDI